jgi:hypothetical protein
LSWMVCIILWQTPSSYNLIKSLKIPTKKTYNISHSTLIVKSLVSLCICKVIQHSQINWL